MNSEKRPKRKIIVRKKRIIKKRKGSSSSPSAPSVPSTAEDAISAKEKQDPPKPELIEYFCSYCRKVNKALTGQAGTQTACSDCGKSVLVPKLPAGAKSEGESESGVVFKFFCMYCGQKLASLEHMAGTKTVCPTCDNPLEVPQHRPVHSGAKGKEGDQSSDVFGFYCNHCGQPLSALRQWAGSRFCCTGCRVSLPIPEPPES